MIEYRGRGANEPRNHEAAAHTHARTTHTPASYPGHLWIRLQMHTLLISGRCYSTPRAAAVLKVVAFVALAEYVDALFWALWQRAWSHVR